MPVRISVNGLSPVHSGSDGVSTATVPDVCLTPPDGGPLPYPNVAYSKDLARGSRSVFFDGGNQVAHAASTFAVSSGGEPGALGGVVSGTSCAEASWLTYSLDVKVEGRGVARLTDKMLHNRGNTIDAGGEVQANVKAPRKKARGAAAAKAAGSRKTTTKRAPRRKMEIAVQDAAAFEGCDPADPNAVARRDTLLTLAWDMGARFVRVNCYWGMPDRWARIDAFIGVAMARGFAVQVTLTGGSSGWTGGKGVNTSPKAFGDFVAERINHYKTLGVRRYALWNEPNHPAFFTAGKYAKTYLKTRDRAEATQSAAAAEPDAAKKKALEKKAKALRKKVGELYEKHIFPANARMYARVFAAGYRRALAGDKNAQIHLGELSSSKAQDFLRRMAKERKLRADGLALHPYQYQIDPRKPDPKKPHDGGMGRLTELIALLRSLKRRGRIKTRRGAPLPVYLTEFGYHKKEGRVPLKDGRQIPEQRRALFLRRALGVALREGVRQYFQYQLVEGPVTYPDGKTPISWDTSIIEPAPDLTPNASYNAIKAWANKNKSRLVLTPAEIARALKP